LQGIVLAFDRPNPEPGQHDIYGQIGHSCGTKRLA
jgi:hypothetical protein